MCLQGVEYENQFIGQSKIKKAYIFNIHMFF